MHKRHAVSTGPEPDVVLTYSRRERDFAFQVMMIFAALTAFAFSVLFFASGFGSLMQRLFLAATAQLAGLSIVGFWLLRAKAESGSFLNLSRKQIIWWDGVAPAERHVIDVGFVTEMWIEANGNLHFCTAVGETGVLPSDCMEDDDTTHHARRWAEKLQSYLPGIVLREPVRDRPFKQRMRDWAQGGES